LLRAANQARHPVNNEIYHETACSGRAPRAVRKARHGGKRIRQQRDYLRDAIFRFSLPPIGFNLQVAAGRRIVLSFLGSPANPRVKQELAALPCGTRQFDEDRLRFCAKSAISPWPKPWR
jgi:hypothetical protein